MKLPKLNTKSKAIVLTALLVVMIALLVLFAITYPEKALGILLLGIILFLIGYFVLALYYLILNLVRKYERKK